MTKITFEVHVSEGEAAQMIDALKDVVEEFEFPEYLIGCGAVACSNSQELAANAPQAIVDLDAPREGESFAEYVGRALPDFARLDDEEDDETDPCIVLPGMVVELANGLVYQVFSIDATGRVILDQLEEIPTHDCDGEA